MTQYSSYKTVHNASLSLVVDVASIKSFWGSHDMSVAVAVQITKQLSSQGLWSHTCWSNTAVALLTVGCFCLLSFNWFTVLCIGGEQGFEWPPAVSEVYAGDSSQIQRWNRGPLAIWKVGSGLLMQRFSSISTCCSHRPCRLPWNIGLLKKKIGFHWFIYAKLPLDAST